jgi:mannose-6-phosphate isomerase class I
MIDKILEIDDIRQSEQFLMPSSYQNNNSNRYEIYPSFNIESRIHSGYTSLVERLLTNSTTIVFDGYIGVNWSFVKRQTEIAFQKEGKTINWISIDDYLKEDQIIENLVSPYLGGDDPLFGKIYPGELSDFYDLDRISELKIAPNSINIIFGSGAALAGEEFPIVYFDLPKNELQFRSRAGSVKNLGKSLPEDPKKQYKRFYFIDWVVLNKHKHRIFHRIDFMVDEQRPDDINWITGKDLRIELANMSSNAFRAKPWFEPGIWGGQWIKNNIDGLNKSVKNYAWSFELIAPENGIVLENNSLLMEVSIDCLLYYDNKAILGKAANRFGHKFPIRFDFLDTIDGGNLSLQCHPSLAYAKENFGEDFTQDETYYILESKPDAEVYLGFQENIDKNTFRNALQSSFDEHSTVDVKKYIQSFPASKHDLFLIPNGTVHCSGRGNLVLEISATPYIFTFKMYDWLRPDLNGLPRPLNINRAFENLDFTRKGQVVNDTLISKSKVLKEGNQWRILELSTHQEHFYAIQRLEFQSCINDSTNDQCLVMSLVEGQSITVVTGERRMQVNYAETFIIPANAGSFLIKNNGDSIAKVIKAFVKDSSC